MGRTLLPGSQPLAPAPPSHPPPGLGSSWHLPGEGAFAEGPGPCPTLARPRPAPDAHLYPSPPAAAHAAHPSRTWEGLIDLGKRQQNPQRPRSLAAARRRGSSFCFHHLGFSPHQGSGEGYWVEPSPTPSSSARLPETRSDENVFLQIKPSQDSPSGAGSKPGVRGARPGGGGRSSSSSKGSASHPPSRPPPACTKGRPARGRSGAHLPLPPRKNPSCAPLCPVRAAEGVRQPLPLLPVTRGETPS